MELNKMPCLREELEQLSTAQLRQLLYQELDRDTLDGERVRMLTGILNERHEQQAQPHSPETLQAWEKCQADWAADEKALKDQKRRRLGRYIQRASVAAVLVLVCVGFMTAPRVSGANNFLDFLTRWSDNVFAIFGPSNADDLEEQEYVFQTDNPGLQEVYDEVAGMGVTVPVVPMRLPDGAVLDEMKVTHTRTRTYIYARFITEDTEIILEYSLYGADVLREYPWDMADAETYECDGIVHNIIGNEDFCVAVWARENLECSVIVDCQEDVLYNILDSIYTTEDIE